MSFRVYGQGHHHPYYPPPPPPPKPGLSPLVIVLLVLGGMFVLGAGACVVVGAFAVLAANADPDLDEGADGNGGALTTPASPTGTPLGEPMGEDDDLPSGDEPGTEEGDDSAGGTAISPSASAGTNGAATAPTSGAATGGRSWWCTASASVRVCGFAGACNYQMVFGNGSGTDRFFASQQAQRACEASARAKGASAVCIVQCSPR